MARGMLFDLARPALFAIDPERAHRLTVRALALADPRDEPPAAGALAIDVAGLGFPNPLGMAAGFDKDAEVPDQLLGLGFGFAEVGSITPRPQAGNPRPRLFRLVEDRAVINRMGFNNGGSEIARDRLVRRAGRPWIVGINVGANKDSEDRIADYVAMTRVMAPLASYLAVNISSPNTPGLRALQDEGALTGLLDAVHRGARHCGAARLPEGRARSRTCGHRRDCAHRPRPQVGRADRFQYDHYAPGAGCRANARETGGLSGAPLRDLAQQRLRDFRKATGVPFRWWGRRDRQCGRRLGPHPCGRQPGAAVQRHGYEGPGLPRRILPGLSEALMRRDGFASIAEAVGSE